jgi:hypothetical protein
MSRWRAAAIHLALSLPFIAAICWLQAKLWYPAPPSSRPARTGCC